tara:strand:- start:2064 stop:2294 length:231 start_codon:yes stop_codon:yes gene_type:complete
MPEFYVDVSYDDIFSQMADEDLLQELQRRDLDDYHVEELPVAIDLLSDVATFLREKNRRDLAVRIEELKDNLNEND